MTLRHIRRLVWETGTIAGLRAMSPQIASFLPPFHTVIHRLQTSATLEEMAHPKVEKFITMAGWEFPALDTQATHVGYECACPTSNVDIYHDELVGEAYIDD